MVLRGRVTSGTSLSTTVEARQQGIILHGDSRKLLIRRKSGGKSVSPTSTTAYPVLPLTTNNRPSPSRTDDCSKKMIRRKRSDRFCIWVSLTFTGIVTIVNLCRWGEQGVFFMRGSLHSDRFLLTSLKKTEEAIKKRGMVDWKYDFTGRDTNRDRLLEWWLAHPTAPIGLSCQTVDTKQDDNSPLATRNDENEGMYIYNGFALSPPVFRGRDPVASKGRRRQLAFVIPFVEFQLAKLTALLTDRWQTHPPCTGNTSLQDADLIFFTEDTLSPAAMHRIRSVYAELGANKTGCFRNADEPIFLSLADELMMEEKKPELSHLEGAAFTFYQLTPLLEQRYETFMLAEPDVAPIQSNFLPAIVEKSRSVNCGSDGLWQIGSNPLANDVRAGMLQERLDYHMNGNSLYVLGCPDYEQYKCNVQTFYVPKGDCPGVGGCTTHEAYEGGYDHAMYRYRMHQETFEYSRLVLDKFLYSHFVQNKGEAIYDPDEVAAQSPSTYFVHSKSIFQNAAATTLKEITVGVLKRDPCDGGAAETEVLKKAYHKLRSAEYTRSDAFKHICHSSLGELFGPRLCELFQHIIEGSSDDNDWENRMKGRPYLWTMDFHGGPQNCDEPIITEAGGSTHAEIDGICHFYGNCKERLKVLKADEWKEFDPSDSLKEEFRLAYKDDPEFKRVDAFVCRHPAANCELFLPFNRSIIVHASTRIEFGRHDEGIDWRLASGYDRKVGKQKWKRWVETLQNLATDERNVIAANNLYDRDYIKYFTGIKNVMLLPSWCGENVGTTFCEAGWESNKNAYGWFPSEPEIVIVPYRSNLDRSRYDKDLRDPVDHPIIKELKAVPTSLSKGISVKMMSQLYGDANPLRMQKHPAIIILPYQISTIQLVELYRMNIPTFCPSLALLKRWCREHDLMWEAHYGWPEKLSKESNDIPDPNGHLHMDKQSSEWEAMFDHWMPKADFYQYEHIVYFDSWEEFHRLYKTMRDNGRLEVIHRNMAKTNSIIREQLVNKWRDILVRVKRN